MGRAAQRMQALIEDLLQLSQVTAKGRPFQKVDLKEIASEVIEDLEARIIETQGNVKLGFLPTVDADPLQIRLLLQNLIGNALKYHKVGLPPAVYLSSQPNESGGWGISVRITESGWMKNSQKGFSSPLKDYMEDHLTREQGLVWLSARRLHHGRQHNHKNPTGRRQQIHRHSAQGAT